MDYNGVKMKNVYGNLYVHKSNIEELPNSDRELLTWAIRLLPPNTNWNLIKIARDKISVSFMNYPNFFENPHPALKEYTKVDLGTGTIKHSEITRNPPILHRKETFIAPTNNSYYLFKQLTEQEEKAGLYQKSLLSKIGRRDYWDELLAKKNLTIKNHRLIHGSADI